MNEKLLRRREVEAMTGLSRSGLYAKIAAGTFPAPVKISTQAVAWPESAVQEWIAARIAESQGGQAA